MVQQVFVYKMKTRCTERGRPSVVIAPEVINWHGLVPLVESEDPNPEITSVVFTSKYRTNPILFERF